MEQRESASFIEIDHVQVAVLIHKASVLFQESRRVHFERKEDIGICVQTIEPECSCSCIVGILCSAMRSP